MRLSHFALAALLATLAPLAGCGGDGADDSGPALAGGRIRAVLVGSLPDGDPLADTWSVAPETVVPLLVQDVAEPRRTASGVGALRLRAAHDGHRIAFRLRWEDESPQSLVDVDRSTDAVALQFPATGPDGALPDAMMGEKGKPVAILHWTLARQDRLDGKPFGIPALYPHASVDHYPPEAGRDEATKATLEVMYAPARAAGNLVADRKPRSAVQDLVAEGFGSLAPAKEATATGRGVWRDGLWSVVISRPLDRGPSTTTALSPGGATYLAVAVWDGAAEDQGARKMRSTWVRIVIEDGGP